MAHSLSFAAARVHLDALFARGAGFDVRSPGVDAGAPVANAAAGSAGAAGATAATIAAVGAESRARVEQWLTLLIEWNARIDLTAARTEAELCDLMLADALVLAAPGRIPEGARVVD